MLRCDLPAALAREESHARLTSRHRFDELVGSICGCVRGNDDLELVGGVVEREQVLEPALDLILLVVAAMTTATDGSKVSSFATRRGRIRATRPAAAG